MGCNINDLLDDTRITNEDKATLVKMNTAMNDSIYRQYRGKGSKDLSLDSIMESMKTATVYDEEANTSEQKNVTSYTTNKKENTVSILFDDKTSITINVDTGESISDSKGIDNWIAPTTQRYGSDAKSEQTLRYESLGKDIHKDIKKVLKLNSNLGKLPDAPSQQHQEHLQEVLSVLDTDFLLEVDTLVNTEAEKASGSLDTGKGNLYLNLNTKKKSDAGNAKSAMEVHAHEVIHAFTAYALSLKNMMNHSTVKKLWNLYHLAEKNVTWKNFLPKESIDSLREEEIAKATYKYIFQNKKGNGLHEFIAHGLTNEALVAYLKTIQVSDSNNTTEEASSILGLLKKLWSGLMSLIMGNVKYGDNGATVYESLLGLTLQLGETNNAAINKVMKNDGMFTHMFRLLNVANKKGEDLIKRVEKHLDGYGIPQMPKDATVFQQAMFLAKYSYRLMSDPRLRPELEHLMTAVGMNPEGMITNIIKDMRSSDSLDDIVEMLGYANGSIEEHKVLITKAAKGAITEMFKEPLSQKSKEVLTLGVLDIDLSSIAGRYSNEELVAMLENKTVREKEIRRIEAELKQDKAYGNWYVTQAKGLGYYMVTHTAGLVQNFNAEGIARLVHTGLVQSKPSAKLIKDIDTLATLRGISYNSKEVNAEVARMMKEDPDGVRSYMKYHELFKKESKEVLFGGKSALTIKGYTKELTDNTIEIKVMPLSMQAEMENEGFELVSQAKKSPLDTSIEPMGVYKSKAFVSQSYNPGVTRITDLGRRGTTLGDIRRKGNESYQKDREKIDIAILKRTQRAMAKEMMAGKYNRDEDIGLGLAPVINEKYGLSSFRYMMSKQDKADLLEQDLDGVEVLARMHSNMYDKSKTEVQNKDVLEVILQDMKENYVEGEVYGNNRREYVKITEDSHIDEVRAIYALLPRSFKEAISHAGTKGIAVRRDMLHAYFGFKDATILNAGGFGLYLNEMFPKELQELLRVIEGYWKELIKVSKVDIIIRTPIVLIDNVISNMFWSVQTGNNPLQVLKRTIANFIAVHEYISLRDKHELLVQKSMSGDKGAKQSAANMMVQIEEHPLHKLMAAGLYQSVQTEDIGASDTKSTNKFAKKIDATLEYAPGFVKDGLHWMFLSEKTAFFKVMTRLTQYSDVVARVTEHSFLIEQGVSEDKALKTVITAFVNYNKVSSSKEQWLNDMGLLMFTKYFKRTQRALQYLVEKKPVSFLASIIGQELLVDIPDVGEQSIWTKNYSGMLHNPIENLQNAVTPTMMEVVLGSDESGTSKYISKKDITVDTTTAMYTPKDKLVYADDVLAEIVSKKDATKDEVRIAKMLKKSLPSNGLIVFLEGNAFKTRYDKSYTDGDHKDTRGFYDDTTGEVIIQGKEASVQLMLHEIGHMALKIRLSKSSKERDQIQKIMERLKKDGKVVKGFYTTWNPKTKTGTYAFADIHEFVSEAISDPNIIAMLKATDMKYGTGLLNALRRLILRLSGGRELEFDNAFEMLMFDIDKLMTSS